MTFSLPPERGVRLFLGLVLFSLAGSLFSRLTRLDPGPIAPVASLLTLGVGVAATFAAYVRAAPAAWARLAAALALGTTSEVVGLRTGFPFGRYVYTDAWWPTVRLPGIGLFPLLLPFAWLLMAGASRLALGPERRPSAVRVLAGSVLGGGLAALVDLTMEPVMAGPLGYWRWIERGPLPGGAPVANFFGWWATAALAGLVLTLGAPPTPRAVPRWVLGGFVLLVVGLGLIG